MFSTQRSRRAAGFGAGALLVIKTGNEACPFVEVMSQC
jgi:hypothetical protein